VDRPVRELKAFRKVELEGGEFELGVDATVADPQISRMIEPMARLAATSGGFLDLDQLLDEVSGG
jgi:hypothetical protein